MTIENLINIIDGTLINKPKIKKIESATIYPSKVESGDLFFAYDNSEIEKAVENGAYTIVYSRDIEIKDPEIAYIKVDSVSSATIKFLRYIILQKRCKIYLFEDIEISFLKQIAYRHSSVYTILTNNWQKSFEAILNSNYEIYITDSKELAESISPNYQTQDELAYGYVVSDSLLKSTFKIDKYIYQNILMAPFFIDNIRRVVNFCQNNSIDYNINRLKYTKEFKPYYIEGNLNPVNFGTSQKVLIFINSLKIIKKAINYLRDDGKWIKTILLTPPKTKIETISRTNWYKNNQEAKDIIKNNFFHYAFCYKLNPEDILNRENNDIGLF